MLRLLPSYEENSSCFRGKIGPNNNRFEMARRNFRVVRLSDGDSRIAAQFRFYREDDRIERHIDSDLLRGTSYANVFDTEARFRVD